MSAAFDFSELDQLAADLGSIANGDGALVRKAVQVSAQRVRDAWNARLRGSSSFRGGRVSYELRGGNAIRGSTITAEVAPRLGGRGSLVWVPEFGSLRTAPRGYGRTSLQENEDDFVRGLSQAVADAQAARGL